MTAGPQVPLGEATSVMRRAGGAGPRTGSGTAGMGQNSAVSSPPLGLTHRVTLSSPPFSDPEVRITGFTLPCCSAGPRLGMVLGRAQDDRRGGSHAA